MAAVRKECGFGCTALRTAASGLLNRSPLLRLALAVVAVVGLELSPVWLALRGWLASVDFDPARVAMLSAWAGSFGLALVAGALTRSAWRSVLTATAFLTATYAAPWAWQTASTAPVLFGHAAQVDRPALALQFAALVGVGFVVAIPGAATGQLLGGTALAWLAGLAARRGARLDRSLVASTALVFGIAGAGALLVTGLGPLVRYGPAHGLYLPQRASLVPSGTVVSRTFHSAAMAEDRRFAVYLPPGYRNESARRYPVAYLLHGDPGGYRDWQELGVARIVDAGIASGSLPPVILVMPDGNGDVHHAAQWANGWDGRDRVEDSVIELVGLVDREYRTAADRRHRIVAGLSEGGFGAANLAARHPLLFGSEISLSGYFSATGPVFGIDVAYQRANSPSWIVRDSEAARGVAYILVAGDQDPRYRRESQLFAAELDRLGVRHQFFLLPGGHEGIVWTGGLVIGLEQLKAQLESRPR